MNASNTQVRRCAGTSNNELTYQAASCSRTHIGTEIGVSRGASSGAQAAG